MPVCSTSLDWSSKLGDGTKAGRGVDRNGIGGTEEDGFANDVLALDDPEDCDNDAVTTVDW